MYSSVFPSIGYITQFALLTPKELDLVARPLRDTIRTSDNLQMYPNAVTFCNGATPYGGKHKDLVHYTNSRKYSIQQRLNAGDTQSQIVMQALLQRTSRQLTSDNILPSQQWINMRSVDDPQNEWAPANHGKKSGEDTDQNLSEEQLHQNRLDAQPVRALHTWGESLISFLQQGNCNMATRYYPHLRSPQQTLANPSPLTANPLIDLYGTDVPPPFPQDEWADFLIQYDLYYLEELWSFQTNPDTQQQELDELTIHLVINPKFSPYIRTLQQHWRNSAISHGHILLRKGLFLSDTYSNQVFEVTGLAVDTNDPDSDGHVEAHLNAWKHTENTTMDGDITHLSIARCKQSPQQWRALTVPIAQDTQTLHTRFFTGPENESNTSSQYNGRTTSMIIHNPSARDLNAHLAPLHHDPPNLMLNQDWVEAYNSQDFSEPHYIYTDAGSTTYHSDIQFTTLDAPRRFSIVVLFIKGRRPTKFNPTSPFPGPDNVIHALRLNGTTGDLTVYDLEKIGAMIASCLQGTKIVFTDCKGIVDYIQSIIRSYFNGSPIDEHTDIRYTVKRDNSDTAQLDRLLVENCLLNNATLQHIPAHSDTRKPKSKHTYNDKCNQVADFLASHNNAGLTALLGPHSTRQLQIYDMNIAETGFLLDPHHRTSRVYPTTDR